MLTAELDGLDDILSRRAAGYHRRFAVDHGVPDLAHLVVLFIVRKDHFPLEVRFELVDIVPW
ncbi:hypothetical protein [Pseudescherichia sp.]|uniref:hypothetical protein n=1 Tax=Pseudescherichia sp. TaxID=2055881 RepID=UPI0028A2038D|nr:hypothetical protein [Pseudescherichia sp.]